MIASGTNLKKKPQCAQVIPGGAELEASSVPSLRADQCNGGASVDGGSGDGGRSPTPKPAIWWGGGGRGGNASQFTIIST